jgi:RNA polymerase sigma-70 factor (ECF subfamily)
MVSLTDEPNTQLPGEALDSFLERAGLERYANVARADFLAFVATKCDPASSPTAALAELAAADLYLAFACSRNVTTAIEALHRGPLADMQRVVARRYRSDATADEVRQRVAESLLVAPEGAERGIARYAGRGSLSAWLRVIGLREAARVGARNELINDDELVFERAVGGSDDQLVRLKEAYRAVFRRSFDAAVRALSFHDRLLLKQHLCDDLSLDDLARLHRMHRATAARQLAKIRDQLLETTRTGFSAELSIDRDEFAELMALIASRLDASLGRLLG